MVYKECKFYINEKCLHEDCPPNDSRCIGKDSCGSWGDDLSYLKPDINDAQHPSRQKAIKILEAIAKKLGNEDIFDNASQNRKDDPDGTWYEYEDLVTNIIEGGKE
jgi:hypothetical protein